MILVLKNLKDQKNEAKKLGLRSSFSFKIKNLDIITLRRPTDAPLHTCTAIPHPCHPQLSRVMPGLRVLHPPWPQHAVLVLSTFKEVQRLFIPALSLLSFKTLLIQLLDG